MIPVASSYHCPLCPRSFHEDAGVRVHLTETHQLYDVLLAAEQPAPAAVVDLTEPRKPSHRNPLAHVTFAPEPDIWTLLGLDGEDDLEQPVDHVRTGGRVGAYVAIGVGLFLLLAAFVPH